MNASARIPGRIRFGGNALGNLYSVLDEIGALDALLAACQTGVTCVDTASMYGH